MGLEAVPVLAVLVEDDGEDHPAGAYDPGEGEAHKEHEQGGREAYR